MGRARFPRSWSVRSGTAPIHIEAPKGRRWYRIRGATSDTATVYIYDEIGYWGCTASDFARELEGVTARNLDVRINSPGGDVFDGIAIYEAIRRHPADVTVHVDALAASAASVIAMAGDQVLMGATSQIMIHDAWGVCVGPAADMEAMRAVLDRTSASLAEIYAKKAGGAATSWRKAMLAETWYSADEAVAAGLADAVADDADQAYAPEPDLAAALRTGLAAAAARLPTRRPQPPGLALTEAQASKLADAVRTGLADRDVEYVDGVAYLTPEAAAWNRLSAAERERLRRQGRGR